MIYRRLTKFFNVAIFWVVIRISEKFSVRAPKCRSHDKHNKSKGETMIQRHLTVFCKLAIFWVVMRLGEHYKLSKTRRKR